MERDADFTLTSPMPHAAGGRGGLLALTVVWHPDVSQVGAQYLDPLHQEMLEVGRYAPAFCHADGDGLPLGYSGISRQPLRLLSDGGSRLQLIPPDSRMVVELNGQPVLHPVWLEQADMDRGVLLGLGRAVLICIHWMRCLPSQHQIVGMVGVGSAVIRIREMIRAAARTNLPVLLLGETGTGKEVAARAIHALSPRAAAPLVSVNMSALGESLAAVELFGAAKGAYTGAQAARIGLFGQADGGTLFLDEIGDTPSSVQPMLLRVLESGIFRPLGAIADSRSSARLISATDRDLGSAYFNQALLRRLEGFVIVLPPLRERREDIGVLIRYLTGRDAAVNGVSPPLPFAFVNALARHDWPGNVRQLSNVLGRMLLALRLGDAPAADSFFDPMEGADRAPGAPAVKPERGVPDILHALDSNGWRIQGAARTLGVSRPTLYKLIKQHPGIRRVQDIDSAELLAAMAAGRNDIQRCASILRTPAEALRRHLRTLGKAD
jgi:two-component system nitrogen regulation response regulator GlnG